jgi:hypothetical protein
LVPASDFFEHWGWEGSLQTDPRRHPHRATRHAAEFAQLKVLYETYCANTNWPLLSPPVAFGTMLEQFETKCFSVEFADGRTDRFSLDKALSKVAK